MFDWVKKNAASASEEHAKERSMADLFRLQKAPLLRFITSKIKDIEEAEEIVQEAFIRFQNKYDVDETASPAALLARIASNLVIDRIRERDARAAREDAWGKLNIAGAEGDMATQQSVDPERALKAKQELETIIDLMQHWPEKTRLVFMLHRFDGLTHGEISERTGIPKSTIEKHMIRAIKSLSAIRPKT